MSQLGDPRRNHDADRFLHMIGYAEQLQEIRDRAESMLNQAKRARKKLKNEDQTRLDQTVSALEEALRTNDENRIRSASDSLDSVLRSAGTYATQPEGENDDGAYDV